MPGPAFKAMSVEEYLRTEELSPYKREYVDSFVYPLHGQAGTSRAHVLISGNVFGVLYAASMKKAAACTSPICA